MCDLQGLGISRWDNVHQGGEVSSQQPCAEHGGYQSLCPEPLAPAAGSPSYPWRQELPGANMPRQLVWELISTAAPPAAAGAQKQ